MNESPDTTGCEGMAVRPTIPMTTKYGDLRAAFPVSNDHGENHQIELWFQSPTGDQSDSVIFHISCKSAAQAENIAAAHRAVWGIPAY